MKNTKESRIYGIYPFEAGEIYHISEREWMLGIFKKKGLRSSPLNSAFDSYHFTVLSHSSRWCYQTGAGFRSIKLGDYREELIETDFIYVQKYNIQRVPLEELPLWVSRGITTGRLEEELKKL